MIDNRFIIGILMIMLI